MGWFSSRHRRKRESAGNIYAGPQRSPGFEVICRFLETEPAYTVLDLGPSSTESLEFLSELCDDLVVQDVFHSSVTGTGARSEIFRFDSAKSVSLPKPAQKYDVILVWDLLHYLAPEERRPFIQRLAVRCAPNAMVLVMASSIVEIPPEPIHFKALRRDRLEYCLGDERTGSPGMTTRVVEQLMIEFQPLRTFQLRNGLQEMVFQSPEPPPADEGPKSGLETSSRQVEKKEERSSSDQGEASTAKESQPSSTDPETPRDTSSQDSSSQDSSSQDPSSRDPSSSNQTSSEPGGRRSRSRSRKRHSKR